MSRNFAHLYPCNPSDPYSLPICLRVFPCVSVFVICSVRILRIIRIFLLICIRVIRAIRTVHSSASVKSVKSVQFTHLHPCNPCNPCDPYRTIQNHQNHQNLRLAVVLGCTDVPQVLPHSLVASGGVFLRIERSQILGYFRQILAAGVDGLADCGETGTLCTLIAAHRCRAIDFLTQVHAVAGVARGRRYAVRAQ